MCEKCIIKYILKTIYTNSESSSIYDRLYNDYSLYGAYSLVNEGSRLVTIEPKESILYRYTSHYGYYELEQIIEKVASSLVRYGKAYLIVNLERVDVKKNCSGKQVESFKLKMEEKQGLVLKYGANKCKFWSLLIGKDEPVKTVLPKEQIIEFNLHDLGYNSRCFYNIVKTLNNYSYTKMSSLVLNQTEGYNYDIHSESNMINQLKATKTIGWIPSPSGLSDSHILYREIRKRKVNANIINYIVEKTNKGIELLLQDKNVGKIVTQFREIDYDKIWNDYKNGAITTNQLSEQLKR